MIRRLATVAVALAAVTVGAPVHALDVSLSRTDIERALRVAGAFDRERTAFHARYVVAVGDATVPDIEVITEFRRMVLIAEARRSQGDWLFTRSSSRAAEALRPWKGQVAIVAHLRFNPMNVLVSVPPYEIELGEPGALLPPVESVTTPVRTNADPDGSSSIIGAQVETRFDASAIGQTRRRVAVTLRGETVASSLVDFGRLD